MNDRIAAQFAFLNEADALKNVLRATTLHDASRRENSGEHSWHVALYAMILAEHATAPVQLERVIKMLLIHDLVEIDVGDAPIHGDHDVAATEAAELRAAERIFGLLPPDQAEAFLALWKEFEAAQSDDAIFAKSIDRVQPVLANLATDGGTWPAYNVTPEKLEQRVGVKVSRGAPALWSHLRGAIQTWFQSNSRLGNS